MRYFEHFKSPIGNCKEIEELGAAVTVRSFKFTWFKNGLEVRSRKPAFYSSA